MGLELGLDKQFRQRRVEGAIFTGNRTNVMLSES